MPRLNQQMKLPDGRVLGYDEYGKPDGKPMVHFHGSPSSRIEWLLFGSDAIAHALNIRVIVPDRPGMGLSAFQVNRRIIDWPKDVVALADHLRLEYFAILGYSGGGPYAAACALAIPERLTKVGIVSGFGPFDQPGLSDDINADSRNFMDLSRDKPWLSRLILRMMGMMVRFAGDKVLANATAALPEPDRQVVARPEIQKGFLNMLQEALRQGPRGAQRDTLLMISPWEFRLQDIRMQVQLWHGEADRNAPSAMGRYVADAIPNSHIQFYPGEGHLSLFAKNAEEYLCFLTY